MLAQMKRLLFLREKIRLFLLFYLFYIYGHLKRCLPQNEQNGFRQGSISIKDQLLIDNAILRNCRKTKGNLEPSPLFIIIFLPVSKTLNTTIYSYSTVCQESLSVNQL